VLVVGIPVEIYLINYIFSHFSLNIYYMFVVGRCNCDPVRPHVTGSNDVILNEGGRTTAVSLVGAHPYQGLRWGTALGHLLVVLPGNISLLVWFDMTKWD
jgi:hypothetical protein